MSENRASGVRNLRAMFENGKADEISSPSRGRSPNDSDRSTPARPLSKVRTNFVAVERPGQTTPLLGLRKQSDVELGESRMEEMKPVVNGKAELAPATTADKEEPKVNGVHDEAPGWASDMDEKRVGKDVDRRPAVKDGEDNTRESLGDILKGSAFEASTPAPIEQKDKPTASVKSSKSPTTPSKPQATSTPTKMARKAREAISPRKATTPARVNEQARETLPPKKDAVSSPKKPSPRPNNISANKDGATTKPAASKPSTAPKSPTLSRTPKTPTTPTVRPSNTHTTSEKPPAAKDQSKKPSRVSNISTTGTSMPSKSRPTAKSHKDDTAKKSPISPNSKSKPKSPTRPARLPSHLTAPTASSQAKTNAAPPSRSPSRTANAPTTLGRNPSILRKDRTTAPSTRSAAPTTSTIQKKASRASLPPHNTTRQDRPGSRISNVASKAPDEGFLARMMRPTASSLSKAHEKIEAKSPPRRSGTVKGKRKSMGKEDEKDRRTSTHDAEAGDEPVSPSVGKSEAQAASALDMDEEKENRNETQAAEDEVLGSMSAPEVGSIQT